MELYPTSETSLNKDANVFALLCLPPELIISISEQLNMHDRMVFSQTCRAARDLTKRDWEKEVSQLSDAEKYEFDLGVVYNSPNYWACTESAHTLHATSAMRSPVALANYELRDEHIQLALKLTRLGSVPHEDTLRSIIRPFGDHYLDEALTVQWGTDRQPKVTQQRFIQYKEMVCKRSDHPISTTFLQGLPIEICHHHFLKDYDELPTLEHSHVIMATQTALDNPGREVHRACALCPTDYTIQATSDKRIIFRVWQDYGSHSSSSGELERAHQCFLPNVLRPGLPLHLYHEPGTIREM
ncbi:hypothetical protein FZEAL_4233 [Fusarium zealandicum]|uniref:F-box domain-containing protein n=1 Tax=Fusarium zealandicum TaxID=1053134 RepID=A0A8H4XM42_9HYPO|nr:hypothetical protein FZEAL_4233 [Fusarium zealandicum]